MYSDNWIQGIGQTRTKSTTLCNGNCTGNNRFCTKKCRNQNVDYEDRLIATIGGGHLEHLATQIARDMLSVGQTSPKIERFNLGAKLGQCCGGVATLSFEPVGFHSNSLVIFGAGHVSQAIYMLCQHSHSISLGLTSVVTSFLI